MPWLKKASEAPHTDKLWELSDAAYRLYDASLHYCAENLTDGHVPTSRVSTLKPKAATNAQIVELTIGRLWHRLPDLTCKSCIALRKEHTAATLPRSGFIVHDYLEYNPSKAEWERGQQGRSVAGKVGAQARWGRSESHGKPHGESDDRSHGESDSGSHAQSHSTAHAKTAESHSESHGTPTVGMHAPYPVPRLGTTVPNGTAGTASVSERANGHEETEIERLRRLEGEVNDEVMRDRLRRKRERLEELDAQLGGLRVAGDVAP